MLQERELFTTEHFSCKCATHPWPEHPLQIYLLFLVWHVMQNQSCLVLRRTPRGTNTEKALSQKPIKVCFNSGYDNYSFMNSFLLIANFLKILSFLSVEDKKQDEPQFEMDIWSAQMQRWSTVDVYINV